MKKYDWNIVSIELNHFMVAYRDLKEDYNINWY